MSAHERIEVTLESGSTVEVEAHATYVIEVGERDYWRGGTRYREGELVEVPGYALPSIVEASPPFGRLVDDLEEATSPDTGDQADPEDAFGEDEDPVES